MYSIPSRPIRLLQSINVWAWRGEFNQEDWLGEKQTNDGAKRLYADWIDQNERCLEQCRSVTNTTAIQSISINRINEREKNSNIDFQIVVFDKRKRKGRIDEDETKRTRERERNENKVPILRSRVWSCLEPIRLLTSIDSDHLNHSPSPTVCFACFSAGREVCWASVSFPLLVAVISLVVSYSLRRHHRRRLSFGDECSTPISSSPRLVVLVFSTLFFSSSVRRRLLNSTEKANWNT